MDKRNKRNEATEKKLDKVKDMGDLKKANDRIKKINENTQVDKKLSHPERGDSEKKISSNYKQKANDRIIKKIDENTQVDKEISHPERGDSERKVSTNQKPEKMRIDIVVKKPTNEDLKLKNIGDGNPEKEVATKKKSNKDGQEKSQCELELRKRIRDKYTLKLRSTVNKSVHSNLNKKDDVAKVAAVRNDASKNADRSKKQLAEETTQTVEKFNYSSTSSRNTDFNLDKKLEKTSSKVERNSTKPEKLTAKAEKHSARRKPMIKTIMSKNGPVRMYKAVTFVDQRRSPTPLEIKIPGEATKKAKPCKFTDTNSLKLKLKTTVSRTSIKEKPVGVRKKPDRRRDRKNRHVPSPDCSIGDNINKSPPTEVARWAPSCIDRHTKPYYEAWVNTTLAAVSKGSKKDRLFLEKEREKILLSFRKAFEERPQTPELFYENFADEKYTGRIKITQR